MLIRTFLAFLNVTESRRFLKGPEKLLFGFIIRGVRHRKASTITTRFTGAFSRANVSGGVLLQDNDVRR